MYIIIMELNKVFVSKNNNINPKKNITRNKPTKQEFFKKEQEDILNKINNIMGINESNNVLYLYDIENDSDKRQRVLALLDDIKKYFKASKWYYITSGDLDNYFSLIKSLYRDMKYDILGTACNIIRNEKKIRTTKYIIGKLNIKEAQ